MSAAFVHRLWATVPLLLLAVFLMRAAVVAGRREHRLRGRAGALLGSTPPPRRVSKAAAALRDGLRSWGPSLGALCVGWAVCGGLVGLALGGAAAAGVRCWLQRRPPDTRRAEAEETARVLPLAADLLAACAAAGAGPGEAAEAVGASLGGPVGERLARAAAEIRLGGEPASAWARFGAIPGAAGLARCLERACVTGAPAAEPVARIAEGLRAERARRALTRTQRAQVLITGPVGLCFLPAFLAVGVAPVIVGLAEGLRNG